MSRLNKYVKVFKDGEIFDDKIRLKTLALSILHLHIEYDREIQEDNNLYKTLIYEEIEDILEKVLLELESSKFKKADELIFYIDEIIYRHFNK